jgi:NSS family neurotransmitter:Na+ symporter
MKYELHFFVDFLTILNQIFGFAPFSYVLLNYYAIKTELFRSIQCTLRFFNKSPILLTDKNLYFALQLKQSHFMAQQKEAWGSRVGLILAMAGNAVGLGNFLRFPVQAIQNGGGAFIIPYIVCFLLMGIPLLWVEWASGRFGGTRGHHSTPFILDSYGQTEVLEIYWCIRYFTNLAVAAYYCYLESWTLSWVWHTVTRSFAGQSQEEVAGFFGNYVGLNSVEPIIFWIICLVLNTWILSKGLSGGVEKVAKIGMPLLILFGVFLAVMAVSSESR